MISARTPLTITLQRQGISASLCTQARMLMTPGPGNSNPGFSVIIQAVPSGTAWFLDLAVGGRHERVFANGCGQESDWRRNRQVPQPFTDLELAKSAAEEELGRRLNRPVRISPQVELYCPCDAPVYDYLKSDVEFARARYDAPTDSICRVPEDCCLVSWPKGNLQRPRFHCPRDGAHIPVDCRWRTICPKAHEEFLKAHNQRSGPENAKRWVAWLISEYRKYGLNS